VTARPPLARFATDALADEKLVERTPLEKDRARAIAAIALEIQAGYAQRRRRNVAFGALAVAAATIGIFFGARVLKARRAVVAHGGPAVTAQPLAVGHAIAGGVVVMHEGREVSLDSSTPLVAGDRVVAAADGRAAIMLATGTHVVVEGSGDVSLVEQGAQQTFALRAGSVRADVAKLSAGQRFLIRTLDAEVEVRGTSFRVSLVAPDASCGGGTVTRVDVSEGVVVVRSKNGESRVAAGESWPKGCGTVAMITPPSVSTASTSIANAGVSTAKVATPTPAVTAPTVATPPTPSTELSAQNDLFAEAMAARKRGDAPTAIATFERFMLKYPSSVLAESATVERMRLLDASDKGRAAVAAKGYLARYPKGFARAEAEAIAGGP
jgi:hypothetical protein